MSGPLEYPSGGQVRAVICGVSRWVRYCGPESLVSARRAVPYRLGVLQVVLPAELVRVTQARGYREAVKA